jgi:LysM repeat protein
MSSVTDALGWLAGAFYVLVALSIVYLFFFRIVPLVLGKISWDIWSLIRAIIVLAALAFLLGCVAIFTADWIFSQVLDTLPRTRMAREVDRVTGSLVRLSVDTGYDTSTASAGPFVGLLPGAAAPPPGVGVAPGANGSTTAPFPGSTAEPGSAAAPTANLRLKANALDLWATVMQTQFNASGRLSDNTDVMSKRDIPQGVVCEVAATSGGWLPKRYEEWELVCSIDNFRSSVRLPVNGTAARGLTGGGWYTQENPTVIYGAGIWPDIAYETVSQPTPELLPTPLTGTPQGGPSGEATPEAPANLYKVKPGDSLVLIAQQYQVPVSQLVAMNKQKYPQLQTNPNVIVVGWVLAIPAQ